MKIEQVYEKTLRHFLAPIRPLLEDSTVTEVMVNGYDQIYYERAGKLHRFDATFADESQLTAAINNVAEYVDRLIDETHHSMDARLPDGSRVHAIIPPSSQRGPCLTIRKFQRSSSDLKAWIESGSITESAAEFLGLAVLLNKNIVISGGTSTGKTSLMNALSAVIPNDERIIVIEDSSELQLHQEHAIYLEARPHQPTGLGQVTIRDLFVDSLRMRPDRILVGEVRQGEALDLIQSMLSGHAGAMTTIHADSAASAASRLETLCLTSETALPVYVARAQVSSAVDLVVQLRRFSDGTRRVWSITELIELDEQQRFRWRDIFRFHADPCSVNVSGVVRGQLTMTGERPSFAAEPFLLGHAERIKHTSSLFGHAETQFAPPEA